tara:strand:- start:815 stop:1177 length:363 start_codon:yes stop_codon:yes gene_type:complete
MTYDQNNIFAKIIRGDIPCNFIYETEHVAAFDDIAPQAPVHVLVIPKGQYKSLTEFSAQASAEELEHFHHAIAHVIKDKGLTENGYRAICNTDSHGGQEVPHFHMHILGGEKMPPMLVKS